MARDWPPTRPASAVEHPVVATEAFFAVLGDRTQGGAGGSSFLELRKSSYESRTLKCCRRRSEKSGAKGANTYTILGVGYTLRDHLFLADCGDESVPYLFHTKMAKVGLEGVVSEVRGVHLL